MKIEKRVTNTLEFDDIEETALSLVQHLLDTVEDYLFRSNDIIVNADTGEVIERDTINITRNLLDVLLNDHCPTRWEYHD